MSIIGLDVGGTNIRVGLVRDGRIVDKTRFPTSTHLGPGTSIEQIKTAIREFVDRASSIGIGIAGIIDSKNGIVRLSPNFKGWQNIRLGNILKKEFAKPVRVLNDVNAILLGEWQSGAGKGKKDVFLFTLGTGVGGAAVCEGKLLFGATGFAGEFGHTTIKYNGPRCLCKNYGCLERYVGARYIVNLAKEKIRKKSSALKKYKVLTPKIIADEAKKGDDVAKEVYSKIGYYIGVGISNIINLLDPEVIIISGGIAKAGRALFEPVRRTVAERVVGNEYRSYKILPAALGDDAGILGAAYFAS